MQNNRRTTPRRTARLLASLTLTVAGVAAGELPEIVAHRGASHDAPENTLAALRLAWEQGADAAECDVHLSADGHLVLMHDRTTKRTAGVDKRVVDQTLDELRTLDVGTWKDPAFAGERVATLDEALATVPEGKRLFIEVKSGVETVDPLVAALRDMPTDRYCVIGFSLDVVRAFKRALPEARVYWLESFKKDEATGEWAPTIGTVIADALSAGVDGVDLHAAPPMRNAEAVAAIRAAGLELHTWTVDDPKVARELVTLGVDSITTNRPAWLAEQLARPVDE